MSAMMGEKVQYEKRLTLLMVKMVIESLSKNKELQPYEVLSFTANKAAWASPMLASIEGSLSWWWLRQRLH
jgi:hypothetical protein